MMFATFSERKKGEKLAYRISRILSLLHQGDVIDKHRLAEEFDVNVRTIERDLSERLVNIAERDEKGNWKLIHSKRSLVPSNYLLNYAKLVGVQDIFPDSSVNFLLEQLEDSTALQIQGNESESLEGRDRTFSSLRLAVEKHFICHFEYSGKKRKVQPYRLIHKNGVWYLSAVEEGVRKNYSLTRILSLSVDQNVRFEVDREHQDYINSAKDIWFTDEVIDVHLRVSSAVARFFIRRPLLPAQQQQQDKDGSLLVRAKINHPNQLLPVVRYWLPHVRILRPVQWHEMLVMEMAETLHQWKDD